MDDRGLSIKMYMDVFYDPIDLSSLLMVKV